MAQMENRPGDGPRLGTVSKFQKNFKILNRKLPILSSGVRRKNLRVFKVMAGLVGGRTGEFSKFGLNTVTKIA